ncbi:hypothetical protein B6R96_03290 [Streptomyces sp. Sge12]|nr:hypothetical protein B6R96_03290 [Streptomyces sp. Sge12]
MHTHNGRWRPPGPVPEAPSRPDEFGGPVEHIHTHPAYPAYPAQTGGAGRRPDRCPGSVGGPGLRRAAQLDRPGGHAHGRPRGPGRGQPGQPGVPPVRLRVLTADRHRRRGPLHLVGGQPARRRLDQRLDRPDLGAPARQRHPYGDRHRPGRHRRGRLRHLHLARDPRRLPPLLIRRPAPLPRSRAGGAGRCSSGRMGGWVRGNR